MGYRSEVKSLIYGDCEAMAKFTSQYADLIQTLRNDFEECLELINENNRSFISLSLNDSKWYDSFEDVTRWNKLLSYADDAELMHEFIRIGEDLEDIEYLYSQVECDYYLSVERVISCTLFGV